MEKLEMQDLKKNIEPILVKIKKRQYKIVLDGKTYNKKFVPFSKIKKKFSKKVQF